MILCLILMVSFWNKFAYRDVEKIQNNATAYLNNLGYKVIGSDGYSGGLTYGGSVFYQANREDTPNIVYSIEVVEWRGELQSYKPDVINKNLIQNN